MKPTVNIDLNHHQYVCMPAVIFKMQQGSIMFCCWFSDSGVGGFVKIDEMMNSEKYHYENNVNHTISAVKAEMEREHSGAPSFMDRPPQSSTLYYYYYYYYY